MKKPIEFDRGIHNREQNEYEYSQRKRPAWNRSERASEYRYLCRLGCVSRSWGPRTTRLFRIISIGFNQRCPISLHRSAALVWFLLDQEIVTPDTDASTDFVVDLRTCGELHAIFRRDRRLGSRQWRERIIRRTRTPFAGAPYDSKRVFRKSEERRNQTPDILVMCDDGPRSSRDMTTTGVNNPRIDDPDNINCDMDSHGGGNTVQFTESKNDPSVAEHGYVPGIGDWNLGNQYRRGDANEQMRRTFGIVFTEVKLESLLSWLADSTRATQNGMVWLGAFFLRQKHISLVGTRSARMGWAAARLFNSDK